MKLPKAQKLPSGMYRCQVMVDGERISIVDEDPNKAQAKAAALKSGMIGANKENESKKKGNIRLCDAIDDYIESHKNVLSPSTINGYKEIKRNRFQRLMNLKIMHIDEVDLQKAVNEEAATVSAKTIKNALGLVVSVMTQFKSVNVKRIKLPQRQRKEHVYLDENGMIDLFEAIQGSPVEVPILLAVWLGLRRSEIMGLCWDCVDFSISKIHIRRTYVRDSDGGYVLRENTKTESSKRSLDCPGYILSKLAALQPDKQKRQGRVFTMHPNTIYCSMKKICEKHDIDFVGVHGLRHTNASVMLSLGIIDKVAMARGGWSTDVTMKQIYQHVFVTDVQAAGQKVDAFFQAVSEGKKQDFAHGFAHEN